MKVKVCLAAGLLVLSSMVVCAAEEPPKKAMSAAEKAAMEAMMKAATPSDAHKHLANMVGTWDAITKLWTAPGAEPVVAHGVAENTSVLGGRWIQENFNGEFMGMPFSGLGYTGYDNAAKQYVGTWMDTMTTAVMTSTGHADGENAYAFTSTMTDPMSGNAVQSKTRITVVDKDKFVFEMWDRAPDGNEFRMMEITYTRRK